MDSQGYIETLKKTKQNKTKTEKKNQPQNQKNTQQQKTKEDVY